LKLISVLLVAILGLGTALAHSPGKGMLRHHYFMKNGLPSEYIDIKPMIAPSIENGRKIYYEYCASCHGKNGKGHGEVGKELDPLPANLVTMGKMMNMEDGFFFWAIADGGEFIDTTMPAFKETLSKEEIWDVVKFIRFGFN
jgi:cytochrome c